MSVGTVQWTNYPTRQTVELPLDSLQKKTPIFTSENLVFSGDFLVTVHPKSAQKILPVPLVVALVTLAFDPVGGVGISLVSTLVAAVHANLETVFQLCQAWEIVVR
ncbi:hypothetical protein BYT27DRAFT_7218530 [Phlegmacium glaucopus]|nr:hypothetical protein BYT27DRAFT_7218530 [Phlegmacium glaucopus]